MELDIPPVRVRYLSSLIAADVVKQDPQSGLYDLDSGAIRLGLAALPRIDVFSNAGRFIEGAIKKTGRTALVSVWGDLGPVIVRWYQGHPAVNTSLAIGSTLPLLSSATGQVFFAFGHRQVMDEHAAHEIAALRGEFTADLEALRAIVGANRLAINAGDLFPGLRAAAAPVFDLQGRLVLVIMLLANAFFGAARDDDANRSLVNTCRCLTESIGGKWPDGKRLEATLRALPEKNAAREPSRRNARKEQCPRRLVFPPTYPMVPRIDWRSSI